MDLPQLSVTVLGAGQEVGRSCCVLRYRGKTVVCDAGVHPAHHGIASLPFLDELDWSTVDAILITHFHLDHAAGLTYIMEKTNFREGKGKVYMTSATKAVYKFIMQDFLRMSSTSTEPLFSPLDFSLSFSSIVTVAAHQFIVPCPGVSFTPFHAGHVLGACMYLIDIAGLKVLYTGDYSREDDRHLVQAQVPSIRPDVLIVESTYGVQKHEALRGREQRPDEIVSLKGSTVPRRLAVEVISFSAHVDGEQNLEFIKQVKAQHIILMHGEAKAMFSLKSKLEQQYAGNEEGIQVHAPHNTENLKLTFRGDRIAKAIGRIAERKVAENATLQGLLLSKDYTFTLLDPRDLAEFTGLSTSVVVQTQRVAISVSLDLVKWHLEGFFGSVVDGIDADHVRTLRVMGTVDVKHTREDELMLEWESSVTTDMIADSTLALILGIESSPASVKLTMSSHSHHTHADEEDEELMQQIRCEHIAA
ncbi:endoribonuclease ysh1, partial [Serendipita sp. 397]